MNDFIDIQERPSWGRMLPLSFQHLFAMFGSTVLVPYLLKVDPATALFMNGIGTLLYLFVCKGKIPAYLGSSFAFIAPVAGVLSAGLGYEAAKGAFVVFGLSFVILSKGDHSCCGARNRALEKYAESTRGCPSERHNR